MIGEAATAIPDVIEPIRGYRMWRLVLSKGALVLASANDTVWSPGEPLTASCVDRWGYDSTAGLDLHTAPSAPHAHDGSPGCGIYAFKELRPGLEQFGTTQVWGEVELWGQVYEHDAGYRAQFARPVRLFRSDGLPVDWLAARYGTEVADWPLPADELAAIEAAREEERTRRAQEQMRLYRRLNAHAGGAWKVSGASAWASSMFLPGCGCSICTAAGLQPPDEPAPRTKGQIACLAFFGFLLVFSVTGFGVRLLDQRWGLAAMHAVVAVLNGWNVRWMWRRRG